LIPVGLALLVIGGVVIALPDSDDRLFSISRTHGPSELDGAGIVLVLTGWALLLRVIWRGRVAVRRNRALPLGVAVFAAGAAILAVTVLTDAGWWWLVGAALMAGAQAAALGVAAAAANSP
jgi:hypothetical protein